MPGRALVLHSTVEDCLTLEALAAAVGLHPSLVERIADYGLLEPLKVEERSPRFDPRAVLRLRMICRLRDDLGINLPGIAVILDLLERTETLKREIARLRRR